MLIDSHVNLHHPDYAEDQQAVIERAREAGVKLMVTICDKVSSFEAVHAIAELSDGSFWSGSADVVVTVSACLEDGSGPI